VGHSEGTGIIRVHRPRHKLTRFVNCITKFLLSIKVDLSVELGIIIILIFLADQLQRHQHIKKGLMRAAFEKALSNQDGDVCSLEDLQKDLMQCMLKGGNHSLSCFLTKFCFTF
jgi:hypothetical protein